MNRFGNFCSIFILHIWSVSEHVGSTSGADGAHENNEKGSCHKHVSYLNLFRSRSQVCVTIIHDSVPSQKVARNGYLRLYYSIDTRNYWKIATTNLRTNREWSFRAPPMSTAIADYRNAKVLVTLKHDQTGRMFMRTFLIVPVCFVHFWNTLYLLYLSITNISLCVPTYTFYFIAIGMLNNSMPMHTFWK